MNEYVAVSVESSSTGCSLVMNRCQPTFHLTCVTQVACEHERCERRHLFVTSRSGSSSLSSQSAVYRVFGIIDSEPILRGDTYVKPPYKDRPWFFSRRRAERRATQPGHTTHASEHGRIIEGRARTGTQGHHVTQHESGVVRPYHSPRIKGALPSLCRTARVHTSGTSKKTRRNKVCCAIPRGETHPSTSCSS
jgi:hypothetical protein